MKRGLWLFLLVFAVVPACGDDANAEPGSGEEGEGGALDGSAGDAGAKDAGMDAAAGDAGRHDAGRPDAGALDSGADGGVGDAGPADAADVPDGTPPEDAGLLEDAGTHPNIVRHGLEERVENTTCFLNGAPPLDIVPVANVPAFPQLMAPGAIALVRAGAGKLAVVERAGRVRGFSASGGGGDAVTVLDLGAQIRADGLRGAAFRPDGAALIASFIPADEPLRIVVARFAVGDDGTADASSEQVLLTVPLTDAARAGGALTFVFDGTLVVAFGDAGDAAAAADPAQLAGKVARIAVDGASGFTVPADNPFVADLATRDEIYARGLRAPTSCSVDRITGRLWCADAGGSQDALLLVTSGATLFPIQTFARAGCGVVVGGVSRDAQLPDIQGALVFGDACSVTLRGLRFDGSLVRSIADTSTLPSAPSAFGEDDDGRMLAVDGAGALHAIVRPSTAAPVFPTTVSATGCLADMATRAPVSALVPYEVRAPLWSDGAKKRRFIVLPSSETISFTTQGAWQFPTGTMFMKEFLLDDDGDAGTPDRIMETRFLIKRTASSWEGYSYMWDRARKDAFLLDGAEIGRFAMQGSVVDAGGASVHRHTFPDRVQCLLCHNAASGRALGLQTGRMNTEHDYDGVVENQLQAMDHVGLFSQPLPAVPDLLPRFGDPADESAPLEDRARAWLYANCAHCHQPGGTTPVALDFRYETALGETHACGVTPRFEISQLPDGKVIDPGHSDNSELFFRLSRRDANQMPPIATLIRDPVGVDAVQRWIDSLTGCP